MPRRSRSPQQIKHFLKEWREFLGITQEAAMGRLDWSQSKISRIENLRSPLTVDDLHAAAHAYARTTWELLNVDPSKEREIVDITPLLEKASASQRREIADYISYIIAKRA